MAELLQVTLDAESVAAIDQRTTLLVQQATASINAGRPLREVLAALARDSYCTALHDLGALPNNEGARRGVAPGSATTPRRSHT